MSPGRVVPVTNPEELAEAAAAALAALRTGEPVGVPTDTVYGLAAGAGDADAIQRLFELKERPADRSIAVLVADVAAAETLVEFTPQARRLAERFWPGPLTIVAARTASAPPHLGKGSTIGVRLPGDDTMQAIAGPGPLAVTSANLHGGPTPSTAQGVAELFPTLRLVVDGGPRPGASSTVVDVTAATPVVLREGPISLDEILAVVKV
ncbi:MAG: threonylcarbamoyl-AMP synthase [Acidimicrobiaceae bacterium]|nr:L-threonylcarbamoyladenylate synthase [Acidimicrobiaceae bacterium]MDE0514744.1 L-threonylcarbamoyladenylate synthase [Acidimicrobiaceae bacterium]MDE0657388.1 L-threonylcarbamoyladenylate synthase [Acidimicrobiaceae bacterium]MXZ95286.1 threonylcarbamoyl-AMP synthase [Acidimicrobiaceae bacterium]MYF43718.1 threonylcarbamoyl-AMP synthase [Acidimicrobiaceae bacterium]